LRLIVPTLASMIIEGNTIDSGISEYWRLILVVNLFTLNNLGLGFKMDIGSTWMKNTRLWPFYKNKLVIYQFSSFFFCFFFVCTPNKPFYLTQAFNDEHDKLIIKLKNACNRNTYFLQLGCSRSLYTFIT
jgi:hypothetical protein